MAKKALLFTIIILSTIAGVFIIINVMYPQTSYEYRQVKKIAPQASNQLLRIDQHISKTQRPAEHFNFPIALGQTGPVESLYSGPSQYPFYCMTLDSPLGQPLVDNQQGYGVPVYDDIESRKKIVGYSKDCSVKSRLSYYRINSDGQIEALELSQLKNNSDFSSNTKQLLRVEQGSINRFIYTIIMPISFTEVDDRLAQTQWNKRLIYQFNGGSGIGYRQGRQKPKSVIERQLQQLLDGYAVISSSGNRTSYTYNMLLAEDTARRVKRQFVSLYGPPLYTVGIGGSGGGLAQYLIAQNSSGILDGIIPLYSYPDMITQTTYALDCDLLNNYFTFRARKKRTWQDWQRRQLIEGMNSINNFPQRAAYLQPLNQVAAGFMPSLPKGNNECINGYFGLSSFINNPKQGFVRDFFHPRVVDDVAWSYWQDLSSLLGTDSNGDALSTWDNVGVQYGLSALNSGDISIKEFLDVNRKIGGWKVQKKMKKETLMTPLGRKIPLWLSIWSKQNITKVKNKVAARHQGSIAAMNAAYLSGQVFIGKIDLPVIDVRHYLEDDLDMHHVSASFFSRLRIIKANGHAKNHVIWIANKDYSPIAAAFAQMDDWLLTMNDFGTDVLSAKPSSLIDSCFAADGQVIDQGEHTWDGDWNDKAQGSCQQAFPMFSTSRIQAGGNWAGDIFKCKLIPLEQAIDRGFYGTVAINDYVEQLAKIFPTGVCDHQQGDMGRPVSI
ncbi:DUF6351 family protein [Thalassotalea sp. ND16A]|uniref:DUF6351 family protein n=1 Tax=Thalassotalea sp. ND16A TaxID=1535422 RepID=UPI00051A6E0E|nr:DUF6351 family protein [Thalassotalea sp. ND16A]KGK01183.1 hypothetical protein ND16A_3045 [Thalassotalea sp. ND16A]